jgi:hypothetical protein
VTPLLSNPKPLKQVELPYGDKPPSDPVLKSLGYSESRQTFVDTEQPNLELLICDLAITGDENDDEFAAKLDLLVRYDECASAQREMMKCIVDQSKRGNTAKLDTVPPELAH